MADSKFTLEEVLKNFHLNVVENLGKFNQLPKSFPSKFLQEARSDYLLSGIEQSLEPEI